MKSRARSVVVAGAALAAVAGLGAIWATGTAAANSRFVTAVAATGDVSQSFLATGTVARENLVEASFTGAGTVRKVNVSVGDEVATGDVLARLDTASLKLALLNAQTDLARAKANLYAAEHPSAVQLPSGGISLPSVPSLPGGSGAPNPGGGQLPGGISATDAAKLYRAIAAVNVATTKWSNPQQPTTCDRIYAALLAANEVEPSPEPTPTPAPTSQPTTQPSGVPTGEPIESPTPEPTDGPTPSATPEPTPSPTLEPTPQPTSAPGPTAVPTGEPDAEPLSLVVDDITAQDIAACGQARTDLLLANAVLADYYQQLITTGTIKSDEPGMPGPTPSQPATAVPSVPSGSSGTSGRSGTSGAAVSGRSGPAATSSARAVASAQAEVLRAEQAVTTAERALSDAELTAPTSGTVGEVGLAVGDSASAGSIAIVGEGKAVVSLEAPLAVRALLSQGMAATVTPAGSLRTLPGTISRINLLETEGTAGDSPSYTTYVAVEDPEMLLKDGVSAGVEIITRTAAGVVTVPVSAVTPTGSGTGTVDVVEAATSDTARTAEVTTGAVGQGRVEITAGLDAGQLVVLSDRTAPLPTGNLNQVRRSMGGR